MFLMAIVKIAVQISIREEGNVGDLNKGLTWRNIRVTIFENKKKQKKNVLESPQTGFIYINEIDRNILSSLTRIPIRLWAVILKICVKFW